MFSPNDKNELSDPIVKVLKEIAFEIRELRKVIGKKNQK